ncbi:Protein N-acetyltransferase, RimJ/RimL family [Cognatiyoonia koreensis]|uniref:Protein N-acetyltransferase, RimJ/RimL family n=1 Tax=Cognatiyoonia koreensis TaxID=364200 RepID=A0A1I0QWK2_9RHOB|nr:GNAT family N-acetyltransferase [Cognatiyoonia koreensis]SEW31682.1 Protein N-acetyltransferase, RimJ/RimL family [Cognatiyoonia koreensis]
MLTTERLTLRRPKASDWPAFRDFLTSERSRAIGGPDHIGVAWRTFASEIGHWDINGFGMWSVTRTGDDTNIALIGPWHPIDWPEKEIGWMVLDPAVEGTGIATEAARAAINHAFTELGWDTAVSYIDPDNYRSIALAEKLGAVRDDAATPPERYPGAYVYRHPRVAA